MFDLTLKTSPDIVCIQQQQQKKNNNNNKQKYLLIMHSPCFASINNRNHYTTLLHWCPTCVAA